MALDGWNPAKASPVGLENFDVLADIDDAGSLATRYVRGDGVDQLWARVDMVASTPTPYWILGDHLGSVRDVVDAAGDLADSLRYDSFGNIDSATELADAYRGRYAWTGREFDVETELHFNRARYYDGTTGRWISQDPLGFDAGDSNLYRYANNRPMDTTDANGLTAQQGQNTFRSLTTEEKTMVAVFHNALFKLSDAEFKQIRNETKIGVPSDFRKVENNDTGLKGMISDLLGPVTAFQIRTLINALGAGGGTAFTLPGAVSPTRKTIILSPRPLDGLKNNTVADVKLAIRFGHEMVHVIDMLRQGRNGSNWMSMYVREYGTNARSTAAIPTAVRATREDLYYYVPREVIAYAFQEAARDVLNDAANKKRFENVCKVYSDKTALGLNKSNADAKALSGAFITEYKKQLTNWLKAVATPKVWFDQYKSTYGVSRNGFGGQVETDDAVLKSIRAQLGF